MSVADIWPSCSHLGHQLKIRPWEVISHDFPWYHKPEWWKGSCRWHIFWATVSLVHVHLIKFLCVWVSEWDRRRFTFVCCYSFNPLLLLLFFFSFSHSIELSLDHYKKSIVFRFFTVNLSFPPLAHVPSTVSADSSVQEPVDWVGPGGKYELPEWVKVICTVTWCDVADGQPFKASFTVV